MCLLCVHDPVRMTVGGLIWIVCAIFASQRGCVTTEPSKLLLVRSILWWTIYILQMLGTNIILRTNLFKQNKMEVNSLSHWCFLLLYKVYFHLPTMCSFFTINTSISLKQLYRGSIDTINVITKELNYVIKMSQGMYYRVCNMHV